MRKFYLENSIGERRDLQTKQEIHLRNPAGLGWADNNTYADARGFFPRTDSRPVQPSIVGDFVIKGYDAYKELADWLHQGYDLTLVYDPNGTEYRIDIDVQSFHKGEVNAWGWLECPFTIIAKTPWYKPTTRELVIAPPSSEVGYKRYPYKYPYQYASASLSNSVEITANGHMDAAVYLTCPGALVNPTITLSLDGVEIGKLDLTGVSIGSGHTLIFSTKFGSIGVWNDDVDLLDQLDLNNNNFFAIPVGKTCVLTLYSDSDIATTATILLYEYYRSV
jgi:hypothetical protein